MAIDGGLWDWMKPKLKVMPGLHIERVENLVGSGTPDVDGCYKGHSFKIELKRGEAVKTSDKIDVKFQPMQPKWLRKRWEVGGNSWVLIKVGMGNKMQLFMIRGCDIGETRSVGEKLVWTTSIEHLSDVSVIAPQASPEEIILTAAGLQF